MTDGIIQLICVDPFDFSLPLSLSNAGVWIPISIILGIKLFLYLTKNSRYWNSPIGDKND